MVHRVYLDWNATTPLRFEARDAMTRAFGTLGNPSSVHAEGRAARALVEQARRDIADCLGLPSSTVVFTSGGTEANSHALTPGWNGGSGPAERLIVSAIEHPSVLAGGRFSKDLIGAAPVDSSGVIDLDALTDMLRGKPPALVSLMLANNETGVIQPIREAAAIVHDNSGILHVDAVQAFGKIPIDISGLRADLLTISAHKIGGPKGVGALLTANEKLLGAMPLLRGGGQELNRRAGTENLSGITGFAAAVRAAISTMASENARQTALRDRLEAGLLEVPDTVIFSQHVQRLPNTTLFTVPGLSAETAVIAFDLEGIALSSGSACSSGKVTPSHVLQAMGIGSALARGALRLSLGWETTEQDIETCMKAWRKLSRVLVRAPAGTAV